MRNNTNCTLSFFIGATPVASARAKCPIGGEQNHHDVVAQVRESGLPFERVSAVMDAYPTQGWWVVP
jgi:hypothetical protein